MIKRLTREQITEIFQNFLTRTYIEGGEGPRKTDLVVSEDLYTLVNEVQDTLIASSLVE